MNRRSVLLLIATLVALIGAALVFVYVKGADKRAGAKFETVTVLTAAQQIDAGESIDAAFGAGKIVETDVPANARLADALTSIEGIKGSVAITTIYPGEQIISDKFGDTVETDVLAIPKGMQAISVELSDPYRVAGFVTPGSEVAIYYLPTQMPDVPDRARLLLKRVLVLGVGSTSTTTKKTTVGPDGIQTTSEIPQTLLTIAVEQKDVEKVLWAEDEPIDHGEVAFALLTDDSKVAYGRGTGSDNLYY